MRNVIVTGATSGIGMAFARLMLEKGNNVVLNGRNPVKMERLLTEVKDFKGMPVAVVGDCCEENTIHAMITACVANFGSPPDLCVVNAGRGLPGSLLTSDESQWKALFDVNVLAALTQLKYFSVSLLEQAKEQLFSKPLDIVVIGSSIGRNISPFNPVYGATKFAVHSAAEALRREVGPKGIRVSLIEPGIVQSGFQEAAGYSMEWFEKYSEEIGPVLMPEDIAATIDFITSLPAHVHANNIMVRPTRQPYP